MQRLRTALIVLLCLLTSINCFAALNAPVLKQNQILPAEQAFSLFAESNAGDSLHLEWQIAPGHYLYQERVQIDYPSSDKLFIYTLPTGETYSDPSFGTQVIYRNHLSLNLTLDPKILPLTTQNEFNYFSVHYQGCSEQGFCYPPQTQCFKLKIINNKITLLDPISQSALDDPIAPVEITPFAPEDTLTHWLNKFGKHWAWLAFYCLGVLLAFTPCVLPMIPILSGIIAGPALTNHPGKAFRLTLVYVFSIALTYAIAGMMTAKLGASLQGELQRPLYIGLFALLFVYLGLSQIGIVPLGLPHRLQNHLHQFQQKQQSGTYLGAFALGVLATLLASPCVSAPLVGTLSLIAQTGDLFFGAFSLFMMGLGMGTVLLIVGSLGSQLLPKAGPWMTSVNQVIAIMLFGLSISMLARILPAPIILGFWGGLCMVIAYFLRTFHLHHSGLAPRIGSFFVMYGLVLIIGAARGNTELLSPLNSNIWQSKANQTESVSKVTVHSLPAFDIALNTAQGSHQPVILDFYAKWCISCQHLEKETFQDEKIKSLLAPFYVIKADITDFNTEEKELMRAFSVIAPPTLIFFTAEGKELTQYRLIGEISKEDLTKHLEQLSAELATAR